MLNLKEEKLLRQQGYIDGTWCGAASGATIEVRNPASGELLGTIPDMGAAETRQAVAAAERALPGWRTLTASERADRLRGWFSLVMDHREDLACLMTAEQGKPLAESRGEIAYAASFIEWFAEEGKRVYGDTIPSPQRENRIVVIKEPVGVCAAITPWNFPAAMITRKAGAALAAGCTMVVKPASATPFSALALAALAAQAGLPAGVLNVVTGSARAIGAELTGNPAVRKLSFTGSTAVGKQLMAQSADSVKRVSLELGRQRAFYRLRRCRPGCRRRGGDRLQISQYRPDLCLRQPAAGAGGHLRSICRQAFTGGFGFESGRRAQAGDRPGAADRCRRPRKSGKVGGRCGRPGRPRDHGGAAP
jgi:succinate-semialdehyde dehydrogenase/glutarate-semialdehyde dehydrogenase